MDAGVIVPKKTKKAKPVSVAAAKISANIVMSGDMNRIRQVGDFKTDPNPNPALLI